MLRCEYLLNAEPLTQVTGQPFRVADLTDAIETRLAGETSSEGSDR